MPTATRNFIDKYVEGPVDGWLLNEFERDLSDLNWHETLWLFGTVLNEVIDADEVIDPLTRRALAQINERKIPPSELIRIIVALCDLMDEDENYKIDDYEFDSNNTWIDWAIANLGGEQLNYLSQTEMAWLICEITFSNSSGITTSWALTTENKNKFDKFEEWLKNDPDSLRLYPDLEAEFILIARGIGEILEQKYTEAGGKID